MFDHRCLKISIRFLLQVKYFKVRASRIGLLNSVFTLQLFLILWSYVWEYQVYGIISLIWCRFYFSIQCGQIVGNFGNYSFKTAGYITKAFLTFSGGIEMVN